MFLLNTTNIRIISLDLDGTLLDSHKEISAYTETIIKRLQQQGYMIILNSGRFYHEIECYAEQLDFATYGGFIISSNGYHIYNLKDHYTHKFEPIPYDDAKKFLAIAYKCNVATYLRAHKKYYLYISNATYFFMHIIRFFTAPFTFIISTKRTFLLSRILQQKFYTYSMIHRFPYVEKLCFIGFPKQLANLKKQILATHSSYHFFDINSHSIELVHYQVSKANAVAFLCNRYGYRMEQVIAFGDAGNDLPLLEQAGIAVVMKNAQPVIKNASFYETKKSNDQHGVAHFLAEHVLTDHVLHTSCK